MSMQDPISDMLVRIKNAQAVSKKVVCFPKSSLKVAIAKVLEDEGYISGFSEESIDGKSVMTVALKYYDDQPVIRSLNRISRPGLRVYKPSDELPSVDHGLGIAIISTSQGVMTAVNARKIGLGGEILCFVS